MKRPRRTIALLRLHLAAGLIVFGVLLLSACAELDRKSTPGQELTTITAAPTDLYHPGKIVWHDLLTPDAKASRAFYGELFGWSFAQHGAYSEVFNKGRKIAGVVEVGREEGKEMAGLWLMSLSVPDVNKAVDAAVALGGKVLNGPLVMPKRGRGALISDSFGAYIVVLHARDGDPEDRPPAKGDWLWDEIWTAAPEATIEFYKAIGGYRQVAEGKGYAILMSEGKPRAGIRFSDSDATVRWVPVIRVDDPAALLPRVEALGGTVWVRPGEVSGNPGAALISDNAGALLILQRWLSPDAQGGH